MRLLSRSAPLTLVSLVVLNAGCATHFVQNLNDAPRTDFRQVMWYAEMSNLAYHPDTAVVAAYPGYRVDVRELPTVAGRLFVLTDTVRRTHYVSIRGTANFRDAVLDAEYSKRMDHKVGVELHRGFETSAIAAYQAVTPLLRPGYAVNLTGHSLGGAMAAILMMYLSADGVRVGEVVTFGQPKVTNGAGARRFAGFPLTRVVDCRDPVPLVPPLTLLSAVHGPYHHFGREVMLLQGPHYVFLQEPDADRPGVASFWENLPHVSLDDHRMASYLARIGQKLEESERVQYDDRGRYACAPVQAA